MVLSPAPAYNPLMSILRLARIVPFALVAAISLSAAPARADEPSRWIAALPFGVGQFQNRDVGLGIFFASSEALMGATSIVTAAIEMKLGSTDLRHLGIVKRDALSDASHAVETTNHVTFATWAVLAVAGVLEAQVSFSPRRDAGHPQCPSVAVTAAPIAGGGLMGVRAVF